MVFKNKKSLGFTLIEILIAIVILSIISTLTAVNIKKSVAVKKKTEQDIDDYSSVRDALVIITSDVNHAFHWFDVTEEMKKRMNADAVAKGQAQPFPAAQQIQQTGGQVPIATEELTAFVGEKDSLYLTILGHERTLAESQESDQAKVGYYLKDVKSVHDGKNVKGLMRRESTYLDGDVTKGGKDLVLLENVKTLKFRYLGGDDKEWVDTWKSWGGSDDAQKNHFPDAVEITLSTEHGGRTVTLETVAAIHMPNNDPFATPTPAPGSALTPGAVAPGAVTPGAVVPGAQAPLPQAPPAQGGH